MPQSLLRIALKPGLCGLMKFIFTALISRLAVTSRVAWVSRTDTKDFANSRTQRPSCLESRVAARVSARPIHGRLRVLVRRLMRRHLSWKANAWLFALRRSGAAKYLYVRRLGLG